MIRKLLIAALALIPSFGAIAQTEIAKGDVNLMIVSDLGRNGHYDQKPVAATMGRIAEQIGPDAILALGDTHHYGGVKSVILVKTYYGTHVDSSYSVKEISDYREE